MNRSLSQSHQWVFYLTLYLLYGAVVVRALLSYQNTQVIYPVIRLLAIWLGLLTLGIACARGRFVYVSLYLVAQSGLALTLMFITRGGDFFAALFMILVMQVMRQFNPQQGAVWIGLFALLMFLALVGNYGAFEGLAYGLVYIAGSALFAIYALAIQRAEIAHNQNQTLFYQLQTANQQLEVYAAQSEKLAIARERYRLARDLHDSVTQTIFSMTLTTQSALLLVDHGSDQVDTQLHRLRHLAQNALLEIRALISELRSDRDNQGGLVASLRQHLAERQFSEELKASLDVEGDLFVHLSPAEEQGLFRIAQEALNNIVKHAHIPRAHIRLHLAEPSWMEIEDEGPGFDLSQPLKGGRVGLAGMNERAAEIGWRLQISHSPGAGVRIRVEKYKPEERPS